MTEEPLFIKTPPASHNAPTPITKPTGNQPEDIQGQRNASYAEKRGVGLPNIVNKNGTKQ